MSLVTSEAATVWRGGGRRWLTRQAACRAEARAFLLREIRSMGEDGIPTEEWVRRVRDLTAQIAAGETPNVDWDR